MYINLSYFYIQHSLRGLPCLTPVPLWQSSLLNKVSPFKLKTIKTTIKKTIKQRIKRDNINGTKYMEAARSAASMYLAAREARRHLYVVSVDSVFLLLFDCLFHCVFSFLSLFFLLVSVFRRELCHNGTCVAWEPGARAPGPGGLGGWKPPREC